MSYPPDVFFDIETLVNIAQPGSILLLGDTNGNFLDDYLQQKALINQSCTVTQVSSDEIDALGKLTQRFDVGIVVDFVEHLSKQQAAQALGKMRDVLTAQYCVCLPISEYGDAHSWSLTEMFGFALDRVATYRQAQINYTLFKYNIRDYKKTPDWLNPDNWANPQMWGKYWW